MDAVYKSSPAAAFAASAASASFPRVLDARGTSSLATGFDGVDGTTLPGWLLRFSCSVSCIRCVSRTGQVSGRYQARIIHRAGIRQVSHMIQVSGQYQASITYQAGIKSQASITHLGLLLLGLRLLRHQVGIRHASRIRQVSVKYHI